MNWINLSPEQDFSVEVVHAFLGLLGGVLGIYFILRWGITLGLVDAESRELLLGKTVSDALSDTNVVHILVAAYLGLSFFYFMVHASEVKQRLEIRHHRLRYLQRRRAAQEAGPP